MWVGSQLDTFYTISEPTGSNKEYLSENMMSLLYGMHVESTRMYYGMRQWQMFFAQVNK
jgi:hypothetical protein